MTPRRLLTVSVCINDPDNGLDTGHVSSAHVEDVTPTWNAAGQVTSTKDVQDGASTDLQCYTYNTLGQLTSAWTDTAGTTTAAGTAAAPGTTGAAGTTSPAGTTGAARPATERWRN